MAWMLLLSRKVELVAQVVLIEELGIILWTA